MKKNGISWRRAWAFFAVAVVAAGVAFSAKAQTVESVSASVQGGSEVVRVDFSAPLAAVPAGFAIQAPARVALDIPGATNGMGRSTVDINQGNVRSVNVVQSGDRMRVVVNLKAPAKHSVQLQGKSMLVVFDSTVAAGPAPTTQPAFAESRNVEMQPIRDRRGALRGARCRCVHARARSQRAHRPARG